MNQIIDILFGSVSSLCGCWDSGAENFIFPLTAA